MVVESWFVGWKVRFDAQVTTKGFSLPPNIVYKMRLVTRCFVRHILTIRFLYFPVVRFTLRAPDFERAHFGQKGCARKRAPYIYIHNSIFAICICIRRAINNFSFLSLFFPFWKSCCTQLSFSPPTPIGSPVTGLSQFECSCPTRYIPFEQTSFGEPDSLGARKRPEGTLARVIRNKVMRKVDVWKGMSDGVAQGHCAGVLRK